MKQFEYDNHCQHTAVDSSAQNFYMNACAWIMFSSWPSFSLSSTLQVSFQLGMIYLAASLAYHCLQHVIFIQQIHDGGPKLALGGILERRVWVLLYKGYRVAVD